MEDIKAREAKLAEYFAEKRQTDIDLGRVCAICGEDFTEYPIYGMASRDIPELDIHEGHLYHEDCLREMLHDLMSEFELEAVTREEMLFDERGYY